MSDERRQNDARVCECCEREQTPDEQQGWKLSIMHGDFCRECAASLEAEAVRMRAALPQRIALCPQCCAPGVAEDFYYPLSDGEEPTCPTPDCGFTMVVYEAIGREDGALVDSPPPVGASDESTPRGRNEAPDG